MRKSFLLLALVLLAGSVCAQNQVDKQGRRQGHWLRTDRDGSKMYEGDFVDGLETGVFTYYYHDGSVRIRNTFLVPGRLCRHEAYDEQGRLLATGFYNQRNRDSLWTFYAADGRRVKEARYRMGVKEGVHVVFDRRGDTSEVSTWRNNHRNGRWWKRVGEHGYVTANYLDGGVEGRLVEFGEDGTLVRESFYHQGLRHGTTRRFEQGHLTVDELWEYGMLADRKVRILTPEAEMVSVFQMALLAPKGKAKTFIMLKDGSQLESHEPADVVYDRLGTELFECANLKSRILVARRCVDGQATDDDGRIVLRMTPAAPFPVFLDEDGQLMVRSCGYDEHPVLQDMSR